MVEKADTGKESEKMKPIRVIQYGTWGYTHAEHTMLTMRSLPKYFEVVGLCEPDEGRLKSAMNRDAYKGLRIFTEEEILSDRSIDAVMVETAEVSQADDSLRFARAGFNIHSDKPCGADHRVFSELIRTVREKGLIFQNGYMYRYNPAVIRAKEIVDSGELGELICVEAQMSQCYHGGMREWLSTIPGGMMFYLGCHLVDLVELFMGHDGKVIPMNMSTGIEGGDDFGLVMVKYKHGYSMIKSVACEVSGDSRRQLVICGTKGTIEIKPIENPYELSGTVCPNKIFMTVTREGHTMMFADRPETISFPPYGRYDAMLKDFALTVAGEKANTFDYDRELQVHSMLMAAIGRPEF